MKGREIVSSINNILFPNGYNVSTIKQLDVKVGVAENPHTPSGQLGQWDGKSQDVVSISQAARELQYNFTSTITFPDSEIYNGTFSEEDAVMAVWQERHGKIRIDLENGLVYTSKDFSLVPKEEQLEEIRRELRAGGQTGALWGEYSKVANHASYSANGYQTGDLAPSLDMLTAAYAAQKHLLQKSYSGEDLTEQLNYLEETHQKYVDKLLDTYSGQVGGFLDANGSHGQTDKVRQSVQALVSEYITKYETILAENADPTGTAGTEDVWLGSHFSSLTQSILQIGKEGGVSAARESGLYSLRELEVINSTVTAYEQEIKDAQQAGASDEVRTALDLAMIDMKQETLEKMSGIGEELKQILKTARSMARDKVLDAKDEYFAQRRATINQKGEKASWYPPTDREMFATVYRTVMDAFQRTGDALQAIREGAALAEPLLNDAITGRDSASRWTTGVLAGSYWDNFYNATSPYGSQNAGYQQYVNDWQSFLNTIPKIFEQA